ncbi:hypothetical protein SVI_2054 [Shewanella violacea DSS12]|uniref:Response regulatory domain-containing protein n=1 Tax=Shewanella violacea (strain JCM 10179 / CIP 106290 / LMG 19151 / DSS12) TaxID=637905 RepID=D4ZK26_SHEVD|nr:hypothetical protein SVI_2054 [Shewanella violacea DSS12]
MAILEIDLPDIILLDIMTPKLDGFGLLAVRKDQLPRILFSNIGNYDEGIEAINLGSVIFL